MDEEVGAVGHKEPSTGAAADNYQSAVQDVKSPVPS